MQKKSVNLLFIQGRGGDFGVEVDAAVCRFCANFPVSVCGDLCRS